jgi:multidrug resistance efflux pump
MATNYKQKLASESPTHSRARGLHPVDTLMRTHRELEEHHQHQDRPAEPERDSLTPTQAQGLLTRAQIRAPFDGKIISLKTARHSNTIDNVKAKIDNVKAKIQDKDKKGPWSRPSLARRTVFS